MLVVLVSLTGEPPGNEMMARLHGVRERGLKPCKPKRRQSYGCSEAYTQLRQPIGVYPVPWNLSADGNKGGRLIGGNLAVRDLLDCRGPEVRWVASRLGKPFA